MKVTRRDHPKGGARRDRPKRERADRRSGPSGCPVWRPHSDAGHRVRQDGAYPDGAYPPRETLTRDRGPIAGRTGRIGRSRMHGTTALRGTRGRNGPSVFRNGLPVRFCDDIAGASAVEPSGAAGRNHGQRGWRSAGVRGAGNMDERRAGDRASLVVGARTGGGSSASYSVVLRLFFSCRMDRDTRDLTIPLRRSILRGFLGN